MGELHDVQREECSELIDCEDAETCDDCGADLCPGCVESHADECVGEEDA